MTMMNDTALVGEAYLEHFGVKGMKWGQRREEPAGQQKPHASTAKKVLIGSAVAAGVVATALLIKKFGGSSASKLSANSGKSAEEILLHRRVSAGQLTLNRLSGLHQNKKADIQIAVASDKIQQLLKQPTPKMPTINKLIKADRRATRVATVKNLFKKSSKSPTQLFPTQSILKSGSKKASDLSDLNANLMSFTDAALRKGGAK